MLKQFDLMKEITQIAFDSCDEDVDEINLDVDVDVEGGHMRACLWQVVNGKKEFPSLIVPNNLMDLSFDLHKAMMEHTGGDLKRYTLKMDGDGEGVAQANFEYRNEPPKQGEAQ